MTFPPALAPVLAVLSLATPSVAGPVIVDVPDASDLPQLPRPPRPLKPIALDTGLSLPTPRGPDVPGVRSSPWSDVDRNRIYDDFEAKLAARPPGARAETAVLFTHPVTKADVKKLQAEIGPFKVRALWTIVDGFAASLTREQILRLALKPDVLQIQGEEDGFPDISSARDWSDAVFVPVLYGFDGDRDGDSRRYSPADVVICVIDSGIDPNHLDLDDGKVIGWRDLVNNRPSPYEGGPSGHGTHVAGIAAGDGEADPARVGIAPGAALVVVNADSPVSDGMDFARYVSAFDWCVSQRAALGIEIISISLHIGTVPDGMHVVSQAAERAVAAGLVVVASSNNRRAAPGTVRSPADAPNVIAVGNMVDPGGSPSPSDVGWHLAGTSGRGPTTDGRVKPDVVAPGTDVYAARAGTTNGYASKSGTSMAAPLVAGVVALMLDANPTMTPAAVRDALRAGSWDWGQSGPDNHYGWGLLNANFAVHVACGSACPLVFDAWMPHHRVTGTVRTPGAFDELEWPMPAGAPIALTLITPGAGATKEFDVEVWRGTTRLYTSAGNTGLQDDRGFVVTADGTYRVRAISTVGTGEYYLDLAGAGWRELPMPPPTLTVDG